LVSDELKSNRNLSRQYPFCGIYYYQNGLKLCFRQKRNTL